MSSDCCSPSSSSPSPAPKTSSCCGPAPAETRDVRETVREGYATIALTGRWSGVEAAPASGTLPVVASSCCAPSSEASGGGCCGPATLTAEQVATAVGYAQQDLASLPEGANLGLSCGNPTALASLKPGEVVLDLGSGGGLDCFVAGPRVGASGRAIGVDMTPEMLARARKNLEAYRRRSGLDNVEFRLGEIENLPVADASVDVVVSNCVLNLSPDKPRVWREIARVLKPGGRVAISDLALLQPLPEGVKADVEALVGCVAGAALVDDLRAMAEAAGLKDVRITAKPEYVEAFEKAGDPLYERIAALAGGRRIADFVTSADITAVR